MDSRITEEQLSFLREKCNYIRQQIIKMVFQAQSGHIGGSLGATELVVTLYYHLMKHRPPEPHWTERDRFILSKGHCTPVLYAVLADQGYFPEEDLWTFRTPGVPFTRSSLSTQNSRGRSYYRGIGNWIFHCIGHGTGGQAQR